MIPLDLASALFGALLLVVLGFAAGAFAAWRLVRWYDAREADLWLNDPDDPEDGAEPLGCTCHDDRPTLPSPPPEGDPEADVIFGYHDGPTPLSELAVGSQYKVHPCDNRIHTRYWMHEDDHRMVWRVWPVRDESTPPV
jgi:hypothetical protein